MCRLVVVLLSICTLASSAAAQSQPNILWVIVDDMSDHFACYRDVPIETPHVDALASRGIQFNNAFVTAPVCSTCRSAFITGMYQTSIGAHHHRSGRGEMKINLPDDIRPVPELFKEAGYYTTISAWPIRMDERLGKTDYNFQWDRKMYDGADWAKRSNGQPFFAQIQLRGGKLRGGTEESAERFQKSIEQRLGTRTPTSVVELPSYYPATDVILKDWAAYLDSVRDTDRILGEILQKLKADGDFENTLVIFMTDHGISHIRGKQYLYEEGIRVPLIIAGPGVEVGVQRDDMVEHIYIAPTSLALARLDIPEHRQARDVLAQNDEHRSAVFSARDRCDETVEHMRSVRTNRYKYIRNYLPERPYLQPNAYKDNKSIMISFKQAALNGSLTKTQQVLMASERPEEELYDLSRDPHEIRNLAGKAKYADVLNDMRKRLLDWEQQTGDQGEHAETPEMFDSDMQIYVDTLEHRRQDPKRIAEIKANIELMKLWASEGK